jgi:hypothetical protein
MHLALFLCRPFTIVFRTADDTNSVGAPFVQCVQLTYKSVGPVSKISDSYSLTLTNSLPWQVPHHHRHHHLSTTSASQRFRRRVRRIILTDTLMPRISPCATNARQTCLAPSPARLKNLEKVRARAIYFDHMRCTYDEPSRLILLEIILFQTDCSF